MAAAMSVVVSGGPISGTKDPQGAHVGGSCELGRFSLSRRCASFRGITRGKVGGRRRRRRSNIVVRPANSGTADENMIPDSAGGDFNAVDANMMVLRRRIEGIRMKESCTPTPDEWMDWEKSWYASYRADVNILVADLQSRLLSLRPSMVVFFISILLAVTPVVALLLLSALGAQLFFMNNVIHDFLTTGSAASPPL